MEPDLLVKHLAEQLLNKGDAAIAIISTTGNCVAASIPLAFAMSLDQKQVENNNLIYLIGTGAGLSIASILLKL